MTVLKYDRAAVFEHAKHWAFGRNPAFYDFSAIGGDCADFALQCIYAGASNRVIRAAICGVNSNSAVGKSCSDGGIF